MSEAPKNCRYCDGHGNSKAGGACGFCEGGVPLDTQEDWDNSWGAVLDNSWGAVLAGLRDADLSVAEPEDDTPFVLDSPTQWIKEGSAPPETDQ